MALGGSYNEMLFDNIEISELPPAVPAAGSCVKRYLSSRSPPLSMLRLRVYISGYRRVVGEVLISPFGQTCSKYTPPGAAKTGPGYPFAAGMVINCTQPTSLKGIGRWKTAASNAVHNLTVLDITNLTLPADSNKTKLVAEASVNLASCKPDELGFCYGASLL